MKRNLYSFHCSKELKILKIIKVKKWEMNTHLPFLVFANL